MAMAIERIGSNLAVICRSGERVFALAGPSVREVCTDFQLVRMPGVAGPTEGVVNLRGTLITVIRVEGEVGVPSRAETPSPWCVVVQGRDGRVGLGVDEVIDFDVPGPGVPTIDVDSVIEAVFGRETS